MKRISLLFKKIDRLLFSSLEGFKSSSLYQQYQNSTSGLSESGRRVLNQVVACLISFLPLLIVAFLFFNNWQAKRSINLKKEILSQVESLSKSKDSLEKAGAKLFSTTPVIDKDDLQRKINPSVRNGSLSVLSFDAQSVGAGINQILGSISINGLSNNDFNSFLKKVTLELGLQIKSLELMRKEDNLISGKVDISFYGKE